jgi:hypothetical protein
MEESGLSHAPAALPLAKSRASLGAVEKGMIFAMPGVEPRPSNLEPFDIPTELS